MYLGRWMVLAFSKLKIYKCENTCLYGPKQSKNGLNYKSVTSRDYNQSNHVDDWMGTFRYFGVAWLNQSTRFLMPISKQIVI
ncbi:hypothetical protein BLOT_004487 [Blomia tropicalis]|nr:hypothetical protein BLOT_004487 [Blomia tropicalis]